MGNKTYTENTDNDNGHQDLRDLDEDVIYEYIQDVDNIFGSFLVDSNTLVEYGILEYVTMYDDNFLKYLFKIPNLKKTHFIIISNLLYKNSKEGIIMYNRYVYNMKSKLTNSK